MHIQRGRQCNFEVLSSGFYSYIWKYNIALPVSVYRVENETPEENRSIIFLQTVFRWFFYCQKFRENTLNDPISIKSLPWLFKIIAVVIGAIFALTLSGNIHLSLTTHFAKNNSVSIPSTYTPFMIL